MATKRKTAFRPLAILIAVLIGWVGLALLITFGVRPSRTQPRPPQASGVVQRSSSFAIRQLLAGGGRDRSSQGFASSGHSDAIPTFQMTTPNFEVAEYKEVWLGRVWSGG